MVLYLVQHGAAKSESEDPARPLTDAGCDDVSRLATLLAHMGVTVAEIWHSGRRRAAETAEILAASVRPTAGLVVVAGLSPNAPADRTAAEVGSLGNNDVIIVGHLPHLGRLAALLLTGRTEPSVVRFVPGTLARLDRNGGWSLGWFVPPELTQQR